MKRLAILLACAVIIPGAALAQDVSTPPPTYKSPNGGILPTTGVATVGRDTGSGLPCWVGITSTCGPSGSGGGGGAVTAVAGAYATGFSVDIGTKGDAACATDNGSCGLIALFARNNQRITSLITALGSPFQAGGSIGNTSFGISGTLPAFASTPTVNAAQSGTYTVQPGNTANTTPWLVAPAAASTGGATASHAIVANNTTSVAVDASPGTLYSVQLFNNSATIAYLKLYDAAQGSTTCGSGTPKKVLMIPANTSGAGVVINVGGQAGVAFATAITRCVTTGIADNDTGAPAASTYLAEIDYK